MVNSFYAIDGTLGIDVTETSTTPLFDVGHRVIGNDGSEFVYVKADATGITGAGYVALIDEGYTAVDMIETTLSATAYGQPVGVAKAAFAASEYGFLQIKGTANIRVSASAGANVALNTTATAGQLDDDATSGAEVIEGIALTTANGGSAAVAEGMLSYPIVRATIA